MNEKSNIRMFPNLAAAMHAKVAFSIAYLVATQEELLLACLTDQTAEVAINVAELADILAAMSTLAILARNNTSLERSLT